MRQVVMHCILIFVSIANQELLLKPPPPALRALDKIIKTRAELFKSCPVQYILFYGVKLIVCVLQIPLSPGLEHTTIVALNECPVGLYVKTGKLTIRVVAGGRLG
jgi:hypothetical protein